MSAGSPPPSWPSLYNFIVEIVPVQNVGPVQLEGRYLYAPDGPSPSVLALRAD